MRGKGSYSKKASNICWNKRLAPEICTGGASRFKIQMLKTAAEPSKPKQIGGQKERESIVDVSADLGSFDVRVPEPLPKQV